MKIEISNEKLVALPVQLIEINDGVVIKRGRVELKVVGEDAPEVVNVVLETTLKGATREEILESLSPPKRPAGESLIDSLVSRRILVPNSGDISDIDDESPVDIFYWHFGISKNTVSEQLNKRRIKVFGLGYIARRVIEGLRASGATNLKPIDDPFLRNLAVLDQDGRIINEQWPEFGSMLPELIERVDDLDPESVDCVVATSDTGATEQLRVWNEYCVLHNIFYMPGLLQDLVGYVGPLVVPGQTACFECMRSRQNAHLVDPFTRRAAESALISEQSVSGFHPSMPSILGDIAAMELTKYFGLGPSLANVGTLIRVNLLGAEMKAHRVLKLPRCEVCSSLTRTPSPALIRSILLEPDDGEEG